MSRIGSIMFFSARLLFFASIAGVLLISAAHSQTSQENCAKMAKPLLSSADGLFSMYEALSLMDFNKVASGFSGEEAEAFLKLAESQTRLTPELKAFLADLEAAALLMRKCSR